MFQILTLVGAKGRLTPSIVAEATAALNKNARQVDNINWLSPDEALDIPFKGAPANVVERAIRNALLTSRVDICIGPAEGRRKHLLMADMDATIISSETLDDLAAHIGLKDEIADITSKAMNGEIDFNSALELRVKMLSGLPEESLSQTFKAIHLTPGAKELIRSMRAYGAHCVLISGGFSYFTSRIAKICGFHEHHANQLEIRNARLTGQIIKPILNREAKREHLKRLVFELGLKPEDTAAIGDGANDVDMLKAAGLGVAYKGKPIAVKAARARIDFGDLRTLLFYQGYKLEEFVS